MKHMLSCDFAPTMGILIFIALQLTLVNSNNQAVAEEPSNILPGSQVDLLGSVRRSQLIVIANGVRMGRTNPDFQDKSIYGDVKLRVRESLTGVVAADELSTSILVRTGPVGIAEATLKSDEEYIFIIEGPGQRTFKVLRADREVIRATKEALTTVENRLPSSDTSVKEAALKSQIIVVAKVVAMGIPSFGRSGSLSYASTKLEAIRFLKGGGNVEFSPSVRLRSLPPEKAEATPKIGR